MSLLVYLYMMILAQALTNIFIKFDKNAGTSEVLINEQVSVRGQLLCLHAKTSQRRNRALTDPGTFRAKAHSKTQNSPVAPPPSPRKGRSLWFLQLSGTTNHAGMVRKSILAFSIGIPNFKIAFGIRKYRRNASASWINLKLPIEICQSSRDQMEFKS